MWDEGNDAVVGLVNGIEVVILWDEVDCCELAGEEDVANGMLVAMTVVGTC